MEEVAERRRGEKEAALEVIDIHAFARIAEAKDAGANSAETTTADGQASAADGSAPAADGGADGAASL